MFPNLNTRRGASIVVRAPLPGRLRRFALLFARLPAVLVVGQLDLVVATGERPDVVVASHGLACGLLLTNASEAILSEHDACWKNLVAILGHTEKDSDGKLGQHIVEDLANDESIRSQLLNGALKLPCLADKSTIWTL